MSIASKSRALTRIITRVIDESENGCLGDPENILWFDFNTIKQYGLTCGHYVPISLVNEDKDVKPSKFLVKINIGQQLDKSVHISSLVAQNLNSHANDSIIVYLNGLRGPYAVNVADNVQLIPHLHQLPKSFIKQACHLLTMHSPERVYQSDTTITLYTCEQPMHFTIHSPITCFRISERTTITIDKDEKAPLFFDLPLVPIVHDDIFDELIRLIQQNCHGILLNGESGTGKTHLLRALMQKYSNMIDFTNINVANEIISSEIGDSEHVLGSLFDQSIRKQTRVVIILDELDALADEKRILLELEHCFDRIRGESITVIGVTNKLNRISGSLRRVDRFEKELEMTLPTPEMRRKILNNLFPIVTDDMINNTRGYVMADFLNKTKSNAITNNIVQNVDKNAHELAGIDDIIERLRIAILVPLSKIKDYERLGVTPPRGVLLYGPPGTGKTTLARAIATQARVNFVSVQCPDIMSKIVGESARAISTLFARARSCSPCILFFDQFEAIARRRGTDTSESQSSDRMLSTLLIEMDGVANKSSNSVVIVLCATNRIDMLDPAVLRPGRIDQHVNIPLPDVTSRLAILIQKTRYMNIESSILEHLARVTIGWDGSRLENMCREAAIASIRSGSDKVHFNKELNPC
jgi:SpoVK/Ycf46/Vps4 family AAA+-type ATPase